MDIRQIEQKLKDLESDRELKRADDEIANLDKEIGRLQQKRDDWAEKKRQRETALVTEKHDLERELEKARLDQNSQK